MTRHLCIRIGRVKLENWRLYVERTTCSVGNPANTWKAWRRVL